MQAKNKPFVLNNAMSIEQQIIDSNCNDCKFLVRSLVKRQKHIDFLYIEQKRLFDTKRLKLVEAAEDWIVKGERKKAKDILKQVNEMNFVFSLNSRIAFGYCSKNKKDVSFIPNTCQLETQECFQHRRQ